MCGYRQCSRFGKFDEHNSGEKHSKKSELKQTKKDFFKMARFTFLFWLHLGLIDLNSPWVSLSPKYISYTVGAHLEGKESTILISAH